MNKINSINVNKNMIIDCTHVLNNDSPVYPKDTEMHIHYIKKYQSDGYSLSEVTTSMHVGTHIDAPSHLTGLPTTMDEFELEQGISQGIVCDVVGQSVIKLDKLQLDRIQDNDSVLLYTGWDKYYGENYYYEHPILSIDTAQKLVDKKVSMLIMDIPSPDYYPFEVHQLLMKNKVWLVENVTNLDQLNVHKRYQVFTIPIKIQAEAALSRVFVIEIDE